VFTIHGEDFYRRLEKEALSDLLSGGQSMVLAVGGGLVTAPETYALLLRHTRTGLAQGEGRRLLGPRDAPGRPPAD
jgi:shikimate kinase